MHTSWKLSNNKEIYYTPVGGSPITNVLVYTHNVGSLVMLSIGFKNTIGDEPKNLFEVYTPSGGSPEIISEYLHTSGDLEVWS